MTAPTLTPAEQIRRFIKRHPGEWIPYARENAYALPPEQRIGGYLLIVNHVRASLFVDADGVLQVTTSLPWRGEYAPHLGISGREAPPLVTRIAIRVADSMQIFGGDVDALPPWLADPVRWQLRTRAGELLTLAGSSPADVVSAAETVDEALCGRPVIEPTLAAVLATLQGIGMSCRWIRNPGDTGINPEREALEDARLALSCADDRMTREQLLDLAANLRRVLGVT